MQLLTDNAWQKVLDLSHRYSVSTDAVTTLLQAVANGNGTMAQFYHNELGGGGQWMMGGMTMVGDMFNHSLKARVDGLCMELSNLLQQNPFVPRPPSSGDRGGTGSNWWPAEFGSPSSSGGQNNIRYAYFSYPHRLVVEINGQVTIYDTLGHQIGGVSQQQGGDTSLTFSSQFGTVRVTDLPIISSNGVPQNPPPQNNFIPTHSNHASPHAAFPNSAQNTPQENDIFSKIERLAELQRKGIISNEEFSAKKSELLSRL